MTTPLPPAGSEPIRWGIAATGGIANAFTQGLRHVADAEVVAVASRAQKSANRFGRKHGIPHRHGSYEAMAEDDDVDVVYIATPQHRHYPDTLLYLAAGKHVLCEKPFALNHTQATAMAETARARGLFLMEAIWTRFLPAYVELRRLIAEGTIGDIRMVEGSFGFAAPFAASHRLFALELGGGALLDVGLYPVQLVHMLLGPPDSVTAVAALGITGVDEQSAVLMGYDAGPIGVALAAIRTELTSTGRVTGTEGAIDLPAHLHCPAYLDVRRGRETERIATPMEGNGLHYQVREVHRCLRAGLTESAVMPLADSCAIAATLDAARAQIGLRYPGE